MKGSFLRSFLVLFILLAPAARGEEPSGKTDGTREKLEDIQKRMGTAQERIRQTEKKERSILGSLQEIDMEVKKYIEFCYKKLL